MFLQADPADLSVVMHLDSAMTESAVAAMALHLGLPALDLVVQIVHSRTVPAIALQAVRSDDRHADPSSF